MHVPKTQPRISGLKVLLNLLALIIAGIGFARCADGRLLTGAMAAYGGFLIIFLCGMHGLARRPRPRAR